MSHPPSFGLAEQLPHVPSLPPPSTPPLDSPVSQSERLKSHQLLRRVSTGSLKVIPIYQPTPPVAPPPISKPESGSSPSLLDSVLGGFRDAMFNMRITSYLKKVVTELPPITNELLDGRIQTFCRSSINDWFLSFDSSDNHHKLLSLRAKDLVAQESPRARKIWLELQTNGVLREPFLARINQIEASIREYYPTITGDVAHLVEYLQSLRSAVTVHDFLTELDSSHWSKTNRKVGQLIVGSDQIKQYLVLWTDPAAFHRLRNEVRLSSGDLIAMASISETDHAILLTDEDYRRMDQIEVREVLRCLYLTAPIYDRISIGDMIVPTTDPHGTTLPRTDYLYILMSLLHNKFGLEGNVDTAVQLAFFFEKLPWQHLRDIYTRIKPLTQQELADRVIDGSVPISPVQRLEICNMLYLNPARRVTSSLESLLTEEAIPSLPILRLLTNSWWGIADRYIRARFPGLFQCPYWSRPMEGITAHIELDPEKRHYCVSQTKTYGVYYRIRRDDPNCTVVCKETKLATFTFRHSVVVGTKPSSILQCTSFWINPHLSLPEKETILRSLIDYEEGDMPVLVQTQSTDILA